MKDVESMSLLHPIGFQEKSSAKAYLPIVYSFILILHFLSSISFSCSFEQIICPPNFHTILMNPSTTIVFLLSGLLGIYIIFTIHSELYSRILLRKLNFPWSSMELSRILGIASQLCLIAATLENTTKIQSGVCLVLYASLSLLHSCTYMSLFGDYRQAESAEPSTWYPLKALFLLINCVITVLFCNEEYLMIKQSHLVLGQFHRELVYLCLLSHWVFFSTYYYDIKYLTHRLYLKSGHIEISSMNNGIL
jgi:hypothetical protein